MSLTNLLLIKIIFIEFIGSFFVIVSKQPELGIGVWVLGLMMSLNDYIFSLKVISAFKKEVNGPNSFYQLYVKDTAITDNDFKHIKETAFKDFKRTLHDCYQNRIELYNLEYYRLLLTKFKTASTSIIAVSTMDLNEWNSIPEQNILDANYLAAKTCSCKRIFMVEDDTYKTNSYVIKLFRQHIDNNVTVFTCQCSDLTNEHFWHLIQYGFVIVDRCVFIDNGYPKDAKKEYPSGTLDKNSDIYELYQSFFERMLILCNEITIETITEWENNI